MEMQAAMEEALPQMGTRLEKVVVALLLVDC
jgi:hypothetical protein